MKEIQQSAFQTIMAIDRDMGREWSEHRAVFGLCLHKNSLFGGYVGSEKSPGCVLISTGDDLLIHRIRRGYVPDV